MSRAILNRLDKLEAARTDKTTEMIVCRFGEDVALFSRTIRRLDPAVVDLGWPEREEIVDSVEDHNAPEVEGDLVQHRYSNEAI